MFTSVAEAFECHAEPAHKRTYPNPQEVIETDLFLIVEPGVPIVVKDLVVFGGENFVVVSCDTLPLFNAVHHKEVQLQRIQNPQFMPATQTGVWVAANVTAGAASYAMADGTIEFLDFDGNPTCSVFIGVGDTDPQKVAARINASMASVPKPNEISATVMVGGSLNLENTSNVAAAVIWLSGGFVADPPLDLVAQIGLDRVKHTRTWQA